MANLAAASRYRRSSSCCQTDRPNPKWSSSAEFLSAHPDLADILNPLMAALTTENLTELNSKVAVDRAKPEDVASDFLTENGLL